MYTTIDRFRLAEAYLDGGDALRAVDELAALGDELDGHAAGQLLLARAYYHSAQLARAQEVLERLVAAAPTDHYARFLLGRTCERRSRPAEALAHYRLAAAMSGRPEYRERIEGVRERAAAAGRPAAA
jgi:thioredoxin-like negative regulator of GroEL